MWSLMDLNALRFLSIPYRLCCSSGGGSIRLKFRTNSESDSYGILTFTNLPSEFLNHWNINSYMKNTGQHQKRNQNGSTKKG